MTATTIDLTIALFGVIVAYRSTGVRAPALRPVLARVACRRAR